MITIKQILDPEEKSTLCRKITAKLPEYFGIPEANEKYAEGIKTKEVFACYLPGMEPIGIIAIYKLFPNNADIYWLGIDPEFHRQGIGRKLMETAVEYCKEDNCQTITVETLSPKENDPNYLKTYAFYKKLGFMPLFELQPYGPEFSMVYMAKIL
jgi:ribosomal protein S18 acetylase RimI-like enzyme